MLRTVFMGTPEFALPALETTARATELMLVVTQPDRPAGRRRKLRAPPVKERALALGIEVVQPEASITKELGTRLVEMGVDVIVVAAYGKFLGRKVLDASRFGCLNIHASLLPRHRGASPSAWAILSGDSETGVTLQKMIAEMDAGDIFTTRSTPISPDESTGDLIERLAVLGAEALEGVFTQLVDGTSRALPQDPSLATFAPTMSKSDGVLDWSLPARRVHDHVRAMNPWPVAFTCCAKGTLRIHATRVVEEDGALGAPGTVLRADPGALQIACGRGSIEIVEAQREGKKVMCAKDIVCGRMLGACECLGQWSKEEEP